MHHNMIRTTIAAVLAASVLTLSACGRTDRWCEEDSTDAVADNSMCTAGVPGFEWEPDTHKSKKRPTRTAVPKPVAPVWTTGGWPPRSTPASPPTAVPPSWKPVVPKTLAPKSPPTTPRR